MKTPIYFLSGTMCNEKLWNAIFPELSELYQPIYIDLTKGNSFEEFDDIISKTVKVPSILVGFSLGGFTAMHFAVNHPQKIKRLFIIAANSEGLPKKEIKTREATIDFLQHHSYQGVSSQRVQQFLHPTNHQNIGFINLIKIMDQELGKEVLLKQLKLTTYRISLLEKLIKSNIPNIHFLGSDQDSLINKDDLKKMNKSLKTSTLLIVKNAGHMIPIETPETVISWLKYYLK